MFKKKVVRLILAGLGLLWAIRPFPAAALTPPPPPRPNIVIFLSDDMGWNQPGFQGGTEVATPNIDRLAREGARFTQFYVQAVCSPTRAALLTGRYPFHNGMEERTHGSDTAGMLTDERTMAQALREAGYATAILGKWHLGSWYKRHLPLQRGFDHQYGYYGALIDSFTHQRDGVLDWHRDERPVNEPGYTSWLIADEFKRLLAARDRARPFFYYVPFNAVHGPQDAPPEYIEKHHGDRQLAMLECMDVAVGRMLEAMEKEGVLGNTLVIFFNDNGGPGRIDNDPYRGGKGQTYEGGVRVPCAWRWPGHIKPGTVVDSMVHVVDFYPTLVPLGGGYIGQKLPLDGWDIRGVVEYGGPNPRHEIVLSAPGFERSETGPPAIRVDDFKLVGDELYNIKKDPYEKENIAAGNPEKVKELKARLAQLAAGRRTPEAHDKIPATPLVLLGEEENKAGLPDWLNKLAEANQGRPTKKEVRAGKKKNKAGGQKKARKK